MPPLLHRPGRTPIARLGPDAVAAHPAPAAQTNMIITPIISKELVQAIRDQFKINWHGIHGFSHLARVWENGLRLAPITGASERVVQLFALFHDSRRHSDGKDPGHGPRGATLAELWRGRYFELVDTEFELLCTACRLHTTALTHPEPTVQTCFDADRLDLARVGKTPNPALLCTEAARDLETIRWAVERSLSGFQPVLFAHHRSEPTK